MIRVRIAAKSIIILCGKMQRENIQNHLFDGLILTNVFLITCICFAETTGSSHDPCATEVLVYRYQAITTPDKKQFSSV